MKTDTENIYAAVLNPAFYSTSSFVTENRDSFIKSFIENDTTPLVVTGRGLRSYVGNPFILVKIKTGTVTRDKSHRVRPLKTENKQ